MLKSSLEMWSLAWPSCSTPPPTPSSSRFVHRQMSTYQWFIQKCTFLFFIPATWLFNRSRVESFQTLFKSSSQSLVIAHSFASLWSVPSPDVGGRSQWKSSGKRGHTLYTQGHIGEMDVCDTGSLDEWWSLHCPDAQSCLSIPQLTTVCVSCISQTR